MQQLLWFGLVACGGLTYYGDDVRRLEADQTLADSGASTVTSPTGAKPPPPGDVELAVLTVTPDSGPVGGGTEVVVTGSFDTATVLGFGGVEATITSRTATELVALVPAASSAGVVDVTVASGSRSDTLQDGFEYYDGPEVVQLELVPFLDHVNVLFAVQQGDASLIGGSVSVSDGTTTWSFDIPGEIPSWVPSGTSALTVTPWAMIPCDGVDETYSIQVTDAEGRASAPFITQFVVEGFGALPEMAADSVVNPSTASWTACVTFDDEASLADAEDIEFSATQSGTHVFSLGWEGNLDCDFSLRPASDPVTLLAYSAQYLFVWEEFQYDLVLGTDYLIQTRLFGEDETGPPPFEATVLVRPL
jgi:IPT/TIG domain